MPLFLWNTFDWIQWAILAVNWQIFATTVATFLAVWFAAYLREKRAAKTEHFRTLKEAVINSIVIKLTRYHLPLLQSHQPTIVSQSVPVEEETKNVTSPRIKGYQNKLTISALGSLISVDAILYRDAKRNHLKKFISKWEGFEEKVSSHHREWLEIAQQYESLINEEKKGLPDNPRTDPQKGFVDTTGLASWVVTRQMGVFTNDFLATETEQNTPGRLWIRAAYDGKQLAGGDKEHMEQLLQAVNGLVFNDIKAKSLLKVSAALVKEGNQLLSEAKDILYAARLRGACKYY